MARGATIEEGFSEIVKIGFEVRVLPLPPFNDYGSNLMNPVDWDTVRA